MNGESGMFVSMRSKAIVIGVLGFAFAIPLAMSAKAPAGAGVTAPVVTRQLYPLVDPASALPDEVLLDTLRKGGFVLYMRHTETGAITEQCNVSNLSAKGDKAARELGTHLKQLRIPVGRVQSSPICRVQETAKLLELGEVELSADLAQATKALDTNLYTARMRQLAMSPRPGTNTMVVSHMHGGGPPEQAMDLEFGEIIVFHPDGKGGTKAVARIRAEKWSALASASSVSVKPVSK